jgi:ribulose-phosphate 3-epimerase
MPAVAINPTTPLVMLEDLLAEVDLVLAMSVEPGFGKQAFLPASLERIARIRRMLTERNLESVAIAVDGGVHKGTIASVASAGANYAVVGSALFDSKASITENVRTLREAARQAPLRTSEQALEGRHRADT